MAKVARRDSAALVKFTLRLSGEFHERLQKAADKSGRTLNYEILERLEGSFAREARLEQVDLLVEIKTSIKEQFGETLSSLKSIDAKLSKGRDGDE